LVAVVGTFVLTRTLFGALNVEYPGLIAIIASWAMASWRLKAQGSGWAAVGLRQQLSKMRLAGTVLAAAIAAMVAGGVTATFTSRVLGWPAVDTSSYGDLHGNLPRLAMFLVIAWSSAAFGEEMLFRGFFLTRFEAILGGTRTAVVLAVVLQAALFGVSHYKQGPTGIWVTGMVGLVFGIFYARGRGLWPLILAHGLMDTVSLLGLYAGGK
jgi:membrane protease YdiL (CAAX protease family)